MTDQLPAFEDTQEAPQGLPKFEDTQDSPGLPSFENTVDPSQYETTGQQALTVAENAAQGLAGPLATAAELGLSKLGVPGLSAEDIKARAAINPNEAMAAQVGGFGVGLLSGTSEARLAQSIGEGAVKLLPEATGLLSRLGSAALNHAIQAGLLQGGNEITNALLGQGDPDHPLSAALSHMGMSGLLGGVFGAGSGAVGELAKKLDTVPPVVEKFLTGLGLARKSPEEIAKMGELDPLVKKGYEFFPKMMERLQGTGARVATGYLASKLVPEDSPEWQKMSAALLAAYYEPKFAAQIGKYAPDLIFKLVGENPQSGPVHRSLMYTLSSLKGESALAKGIQSLFDFGSSKAVDIKDPSKDIERINDHLESGGADKDVINPEPQKFADGGFVNHPDNKLEHFPEQNMLLAQARSRISNYLNTLRPTDPRGLPFDSKREDPKLKKKYNEALLTAARPLNILNDVKKGTLTPDQLSGFRAMYPEVYKNMSQKITKHVVEHQIDEKRPPRHLRQSLSFFLGANLDSSILPQNILAAQATFIPKQAARQAQSSKASLSKLGESAMTADQSRTQRLNKN